jgi:hypothetical protein
VSRRAPVRLATLIAALIAAPIVTRFAPAAAAAADSAIESVGSATIVAGDQAAARTRALDDAFRQAVDQTVVSLVDPVNREVHAGVIKKRILRRSRIYVTRYKTLEESQDEGVYHVRIEASVAVDTIAADLKALRVPLGGVADPDAAPDPDAVPDPDARSSAPRPRVLLLVAAHDDARVRATFGNSDRADPADPAAEHDPAAEPDPAAAAIEAALSAAGFQVLTARGLEVPVRAGDAPEGLPLTDEQALLLARQVGAGAAVVVGVRARPGGRIRGARLVGAEADGHVRVLDLTTAAPTALHDARASLAGFGADLPAAFDAASAATAEALAERAVPRLRKRWPARPGVAGGIAVRVRGAERWPDVAELVKTASGIPGVKQVSPMRFTRGEIVLAVLGGASARSVADALSGVEIPGFRVDARLVDSGQVSVRLQGSGRPAITEPK